MFTRFLFKPHESIKVILAILLSVIIIIYLSLKGRFITYERTNLYNTGK